MTIWTKNFKIGNIIIMSVAVFMMNAKYAWLNIIAATIALINHLTRNHCFSNGCKRRLECFFGRFIYASFGAIYSIMTGMAHKFLKTMLTNIFSFAFISLSFIITSARTIFCFIRATRNMFKFFLTYFAFTFNLNSNKFCATRTRAVF